jgi:multidrug efflux pump subunit AcrA (membrane-fusion protein)
VYRNIIIAILLISQWGFGAKKPVVFVKEAKKRELFDVLIYPARVTSKVTAVVLAENQGQISKTHVSLGARVRKGRVILTIEHTDPIYKYAAVKVKSPVNGVVTQVSVSVGSRIQKGTNLFTVIDPKQLQVQVEIPSSDLGSLTRDAVVDFKLGKNNVPLRVAGLSPFVDPGTGTASCVLEQKSNKSPFQLTPGAIGKVVFRTNLRNNFSVPVSAISYTGDNTFLHLIKDKKAKRIPVKLGRKQTGLVEVLKGITDGDQVVHRKSSYLADGEEVVVQDMNPPKTLKKGTGKSGTKKEEPKTKKSSNG